MSSLLQNIRRNIRTRRGPTSHSPSRSKSCDREKGLPNENRLAQDKEKGTTNEKPTEEGHLESSKINNDAKLAQDPKDFKNKTIWTKDVTLRKFGNKNAANSYVDPKSVFSNRTNRSMDDLRGSSASPKENPSTSRLGAALPSSEDSGRSRSRKVSLTPPEHQGRLDGRPPRSRSVYTGLSNGGTFEDSGVDLDSSQGGASLSSDVMLSPLHSRDNSHGSHVVNPRASTSAFLHQYQGKLIQNATAKLSPDYISMNGRGQMYASRENVMNHHIREVSQVSQTSSRSTNSSSSSSKSSHKDDKGQHQSSNILSKSQSPVSQEEVYVKMNDFERERSLSPQNGQERSSSLAKKGGVASKSKVEDHEYVNINEFSTDHPPKIKPQTQYPDPTSINSDKRVSKDNFSKDNLHNITVHVHAQPQLSQVQSVTQNLPNNQRLNDHNPNAKFRKPVSEESDIESTSESVTSQEVAVLTAISRRRRAQHMFHKHVSFQNSQKTSKDGGDSGKINKSLASFAEQSILSFLSNMDTNSESESETNPATRCEHATRKFIKTSPTPTNTSSETGGSPVRRDTATPTNENPGNSHPSLHQIVAVYDLVSLTLSKTGYHYPHYGIHVHLQKFRDHLSPSSERSISRNSSKLSKSGSVYTPPGSFADEYILPAVMAIDQDGVAGHDGRIRTGDYIIEVNGTNVLDKPADETETLINSEGMLHLVTTRGRSAIR